MNKEILNYLKESYGMTAETKTSLIHSISIIKDRKIMIIDTEAEYNKNNYLK